LWWDKPYGVFGLASEQIFDLRAAYKNATAAGYSLVPRDFTEATKSELFRLIQVAEYWEDIRQSMMSPNWDQQAGREYAQAIADFRASLQDDANYWQYMIDIDDVTEDTIEQIFSDVCAADTTYSHTLFQVRFQAKLVASSLNDLLKEVTAVAH
jgi:hypothetical protein